MITRSGVRFSTVNRPKKPQKLICKLIFEVEQGVDDVNLTPMLIYEYFYASKLIFDQTAIAAPAIKRVVTGYGAPNVKKPPAPGRGWWGLGWPMARFTAGRARRLYAARRFSSVALVSVSACGRWCCSWVNSSSCSFSSACQAALSMLVTVLNCSALKFRPVQFRSS